MISIRPFVGEALRRFHLSVDDRLFEIFTTTFDTYM